MPGLRAACPLALVFALLALGVAWFRAGGDGAVLGDRLARSCLKYGLAGYATLFHLAAARALEHEAQAGAATGDAYRDASARAALQFVRAGDILLGLGERRRAAAAYARAADAAPWDDRARASLAAAQAPPTGGPAARSLGDLAFRRNSPTAQLALARVLIAGAQTDVAVPLLRRAAAPGRLPRDLRLPLAQAAAAAGDQDLAASQANQVLRQADSLRDALAATRLLAGAGLAPDPWDHYARLALRDYGVTLLGMLLYAASLVLLFTIGNRRPPP